MKDRAATWYLGVAAEDVAPYVILVGDPARVDVFAEAMENPQTVSHLREFKTITGTYGGEWISIVSTGIGAPSTAIVLEELWQLSVSAVVRAGTAMVLDAPLGNFLLPSAAVRFDGTSDTYLPAEFPAVGDHFLLEAYRRSLEAAGQNYSIGVLASTDGFYAHLFTSEKLDKSVRRPDTRILQMMDEYNVIGMDMETSGAYSLSYLLRIPMVSFLLATVDGESREKLDGEERDAKERDLVRLALEGIVRYASDNKMIGG